MGKVSTGQQFSRSCREATAEEYVVRTSGKQAFQVMGQLLQSNKYEVKELSLRVFWYSQAETISILGK